jgi:hypothetical protein
VKMRGKYGEILRTLDGNERSAKDNTMITALAAHGVMLFVLCTNNTVYFSWHRHLWC